MRHHDATFTTHSSCLHCLRESSSDVLISLSFVLYVAGNVAPLNWPMVGDHLSVWDRWGFVINQPLLHRKESVISTEEFCTKRFTFVTLCKFGRSLSSRCSRRHFLLVEIQNRTYTNNNRKPCSIAWVLPTHVAYNVHTMQFTQIEIRFFGNIFRHAACLQRKSYGFRSAFTHIRQYSLSCTP